MKVKQVFSSHNRRLLPDRIARFCPVCGSACLQQPISGRNRSYCPECGFIEYRNPSPAVSVLITEGDSFLLGKRTASSFNGGLWCLPCGFIEYDEDFLSAAHREVKEETGLGVSFESIIQVTSNFLSADLHSVVIVLLAHVAGGNLTAGDDIEQLMWYRFNDNFPKLAFEADREIIERYAYGRISGIPVEYEINPYFKPEG